MDAAGNPVKCPECDGGRSILLHGEPRSLIQGDANDVFLAVQLASQTAQNGFPHSVTEYDSQAATFIQAWEFLGPFLRDEIEAKVKRDAIHQSGP